MFTLLRCKDMVIKKQEFVAKTQLFQKYKFVLKNYCKKSVFIFDLNQFLMNFFRFFRHSPIKRVNKKLINVLILFALNHDNNSSINLDLTINIYILHPRFHRNQGRLRLATSFLHPSNFLPSFSSVFCATSNTHPFSFLL